MAKRTTDEPEVLQNGSEPAATENSASQSAAGEKAAQARTVRLIYAGPNIPGGILQRFQVFKGGLPPHCKDLFEKVPEIKELFVPVEKLETMRKKLAEPGTNEARLLHIVQQKLTRGVK